MVKIQRRREISTRTNKHNPKTWKIIGDKYADTKIVIKIHNLVKGSLHSW